MGGGRREGEERGGQDSLIGILKKILSGGGEKMDGADEAWPTEGFRRRRRRRRFRH